MTNEPKDIRLPIMVSASEAKAIDDFRFRMRINTRAEAMRLLINRGLAFETITQATEVAGHIGGELIRGAPVTLSDQIEFTRALLTLYEVVDSADEDIAKSLADFADGLDALAKKTS